MKTLMTLLLTLAMLFTLAACGSQAGGAVSYTHLTLPTNSRV